MRLESKKHRGKKKKARGASKKGEPKSLFAKLNLRPVVPTVLVLLSVLTLGGVGVVVEKIFNAPVDKVTINGSFMHLTKSGLAKIVEPSTKVGYLTVNLQKIKEDLLRLPWVQAVSVKRRWPHTIEVLVTEHEPYLRWQKASFLNRDGEVFTPKRSMRDIDLVRLSGPDGTQLDLMRRYESLQARLDAYDLRISEYSLDKKDAERMVLDSGVELIFGRGDIEGKLDRLLKVYRSQLSVRVHEIDKIDMRYTNGLAVQWHPSVAELAENGVR